MVCTHPRHHRPLFLCHSLTASLLCVLLCRFGRVASDGFHGKAAHLTLSEIKSAFPGPLIGNGGYDGTTANDAIVKGDFDHVAEQAFFNVGGISDVEERWAQIQKENG